MLEIFVCVINNKWMSNKSKHSNLSIVIVSECIWWYWMLIVLEASSLSRSRHVIVINIQFDLEYCISWKTCKILKHISNIYLFQISVSSISLFRNPDILRLKTFSNNFWSMKWKIINLHASSSLSTSALSSRTFYWLFFWSEVSLFQVELLQFISEYNISSI